MALRTPKSRRKSGLSVTTGPSPAGALFQSLSNVAVCLNSVRDYDFPQRSVTPETVCLSPAAKSLFGSVVTSAGTSAQHQRYLPIFARPFLPSTKSAPCADHYMTAAHTCALAHPLSVDILPVPPQHRNSVPSCAHSRGSAPLLYISGAKALDLLPRPPPNPGKRVPARFPVAPHTPGHSAHATLASRAPHAARHASTQCMPPSPSTGKREVFMPRP